MPFFGFEVIPFIPTSGKIKLEFEAEMPGELVTAFEPDSHPGCGFVSNGLCHCRSTDSAS